MPLKDKIGQDRILKSAYKPKFPLSKDSQLQAIHRVQPKQMSHCAELQGPRSGERNVKEFGDRRLIPFAFSDRL